MVRNMRAVLKKASWGTRRIFRSIRCKKQPPLVRDASSEARRTADSTDCGQPSAAPDASSVRGTASAIGANYDEFIANPYLNYPNPLVTFDRFVVKK